MQAETMAKLMEGMDQTTVAGLGHALKIWQTAACMAMQGMIINGVTLDDQGIAIRSVKMADALMEEIVRKTPARVESFLKME